ncbi:MAG: arsenite methyltransferase [Candidatus Sulfomarinibacteraceae bacterium]
MTDQLRPTTDPEELVATVRDRYGRIAEGGGSCCPPATGCCGSAPAALSTGLGYKAVDLDLLPEGADLGLGCGAPLEHLDLQPGETVVDLGSGAGIDALIAARAVGPEGRVIGIDMTPEMLAKARSNAAAAGAGHVDFREGRLEALPIDNDSVDAITSNCVINLVPDKTKVFAEIARVLKPGGRLVVSDVMLDGELPEIVTRDVMAYVGCVSGAIQRDDYFRMLTEAGLSDVEIVRDVDFLATVADSLPKEISSAMDQLGLGRQDLEGVVRSVTYLARKDS